MSVFETFMVFWVFLQEERGFGRQEGVIRDQRQKTNQNMYKKVKNKFHSNFALAEPYPDVQLSSEFDYPMNSF